jgi:hypothetical protein
MQMKVNQVLTSRKYIKVLMLRYDTISYESEVLSAYLFNLVYWVIILYCNGYWRLSSNENYSWLWITKRAGYARTPSLPSSEQCGIWLGGNRERSLPGQLIPGLDSNWVPSQLGAKSMC